jgi:uncharacterized glyoxalase superfamily protein PhnB
MADYDPRTYPTVCPYLHYADAEAAMDWLIEAFGFTERLRGRDPDGRIGHSELEVGTSILMLGQPAGHRSPDSTGHPGHAMYVHVPDVEAHHTHAAAAGARVTDAPSDQEYGVRSYGVLDVEGNQWWFAQAL